MYTLDEVLEGLKIANLKAVSRETGIKYSAIWYLKKTNGKNAKYDTVQAIGAVLFGVGIQRLAPEILLAGAFCVLAGLLSIVFETIDNDIAQGLAIVASGLVVLAVLGAQMKRVVSRSKTETPTA